MLRFLGNINNIFLERRKSKEAQNYSPHITCTGAYVTASGTSINFYVWLESVILELMIF